MKVKIWFQNHRYKLKKARHEKIVMDLGGGAASLLHMAVTPRATSPRRVSIPVLVHDGKPCHVVSHQQQAVQQTSPRGVMLSSTDYYSTAGYGDGPSAALGVIPYGMPPTGVPVPYPSYGDSTGSRPSQSATTAAAAAAFHHSSSVNSTTTNLSGPTLPTAAASMNSQSYAMTGTLSRDNTVAGCYAQSRWW